MASAPTCSFSSLYGTTLSIFHKIRVMYVFSSLTFKKINEDTSNARVTSLSSRHFSTKFSSQVLPISLLSITQRTSLCKVDRSACRTVEHSAKWWTLCRQRQANIGTTVIKIKRLMRSRFRPMYATIHD